MYCEGVVSNVHKGNGESSIYMISLGERALPKTIK